MNMCTFACAACVRVCVRAHLCSPMSLKGETRVALYGLGYVRDERLNRMFQVGTALQYHVIYSSARHLYDGCACNDVCCVMWRCQYWMPGALVFHDAVVQTTTRLIQWY